MPKNNSLTVRLDDLMEYEPITINQQTAFEAWDEGDNLLLTGSAGTGKTFIAMFMALEELLDTDNYYRRIIVIRSAVPTRDMGYKRYGISARNCRREKANVYASI